MLRVLCIQQISVGTLVHDLRNPPPLAAFARNSPESTMGVILKPLERLRAKSWCLPELIQHYRT